MYHRHTNHNLSYMSTPQRELDSAAEADKAVARIHRRQSVVVAEGTIINDFGIKEIQITKTTCLQTNFIPTTSSANELAATGLAHDQYQRYWLMYPERGNLHGMGFRARVVNHVELPMLSESQIYKAIVELTQALLCTKGKPCLGT